MEGRQMRRERIVYKLAALASRQRMTADAIMRFLALIAPIGTEQDTRIRDTLTDRAQRIYSSSRIL